MTGTGDGDTLRTISTELLTAFQNLGPELVALTAEEQATTAKDRLGTVRRMRQELRDAMLALVHVLHRTATVHGMRALGIGGQHVHDGDGKVSHLVPSAGDPDEYLANTAVLLDKALLDLESAYAPTRKYPGLAIARRPAELRVALRALGTAAEALGADLSTSESDDIALDIAPWQKRLDLLDFRVCQVVPAQGTGPSADDVTAAILGNPEIARAAAAALERAAG